MYGIHADTHRGAYILVPFSGTADRMAFNPEENLYLCGLVLRFENRADLHRAGHNWLGLNTYSLYVVFKFLVCF